MTALAFDTAENGPQHHQDASGCPKRHLTVPRPPKPMFVSSTGEFGAVLRELRLRADLSQYALARRCAINCSYLNRMESGERNRPTREIVDAFARALGLGQINADRLLVSAGYLPSYGDDLTVRQLAVLLADSPAPVVATLRAQIAASYRVLAAGQEGAAK